MTENPLNPRQKQVLTALVDHYIVRAEPISSKILSRSPILQASSATIRNTMSELEGRGMVEQPHASAGRLPTDLGYRTYVDELMHPEPLSEEDKSTLNPLAAEESHEALMSRAAKTLADMTQLLGLVIPPPEGQATFRNMSLVQVGEDRLVLVLSSSDKEARSLLMDSGQGASFYRLEAIVRRINQKMQGKPVSLLNDFLDSSPEKAVSMEELNAIDILNRSILKLSGSELANDVLFFGAKYLVNRPDFSKIQDIGAVMDLLDSKITLVHFLRQRVSTEGVHVTVGEEHGDNGLFRAFSLVTSVFTLGGAQGILGVLGPKRIPYSRLVPVVAYAARTLSRSKDMQETK